MICKVIKCTIDLFKVQTVNPLLRIDVNDSMGFN